MERDASTWQCFFRTKTSDENEDPMAEHPPTNVTGLIIHVVGAPQGGYSHNFTRNFDATASTRLESATYVGLLRNDHVPFTRDKTFLDDDRARGAIDGYAQQVRAPRAASNLNDPVRHPRESHLRKHLVTMD